MPSRTRLTHPLRFRRAVVRHSELLTPGMRRFVLGGDELDGFVTLAFDDHVKLFFPDASGHLPAPIAVDGGIRFAEGVRPEGRDFTPRRFDVTTRELTIDFGLHGSGPATEWARAAAPGSTIGIGGPRSSDVLSNDVEWHLLVGDATALPAIARRLEECPAHVRLPVIVAVASESERQTLPAHPLAQITWVCGHSSTGAALDQAIGSAEIPPGTGWAWIAGEASMARRIRTHLLRERGLDSTQVKAAAYWRLGGTGKHEILAD